jgi:acetyltransferase-like isoleucine patch superfamily enzyme
MSSSRSADELQRLLNKRLPNGASAARRFWTRARYPLADIEIHPSAQLGPGFRLIVLGRAQLRIAERVSFRHNCVIELEYDSTLTIGAGTVFTYNTLIQCTSSITIGSDCLFANGASVVDSKHRFRDSSDPGAFRALDFRPVTIADGVWVSSKATVAADVGERSVIAANAAVVADVPAWSLAGGVPARVIERFANEG